MCQGFILLDAENGIHVVKWYLELKTLTSWRLIKEITKSIFFFLTSEAHELKTGTKEGPEPQTLYSDKDFLPALYTCNTH